MGGATIKDANLTKLLNRLGSLGAAAIGMDLFRDQPEGTKAERAELIAALRKNHVFCVEFPSDIPTRKVAGPAELYPNNFSQIITCSSTVDDDGESRLAYLYSQPSNDVWRAMQARAAARHQAIGSQADNYEMCLSSAVANYFLSTDPRHKNTPDEWRLKDRPDLQPWVDKIPRMHRNDAAYVSHDLGPEDGYQYLLDFRGPEMKIESQAGPENSVRLTVRQLLDPSDLKNFDQVQQELKLQAADNAKAGLPPPVDELPVNEQRNAIKGKIVLIGQEAMSVKDYDPCPRGAYFRGVEYHALATDYLLRVFRGWASPRQFFSKPQEIFWIFCWSFVGVTGGYYFSSLGRLLILFFSSVPLLGCIVYVAFVHNWWLPALPPAVCFVASAGLMTGYMSQHERGNRLVMNNLFKRMSGDDVVSEVWAKRDEIFEHGRIAPRLVIATMLFIDFEGFSKKTESLKDPKQLTNWLFETMQAMNEVTLKSGGTILRYMGDSFLVAFGAPLYRSNEKEYAADAQSAVKCALAIRGALAALNAKWEKAQQPTWVHDTLGGPQLTYAGRLSQ
jgi:CHASE2 domain-containing sensor protein